MVTDIRGDRCARLEKIKKYSLNGCFLSVTCEYGLHIMRVKLVKVELVC